MIKLNLTTNCVEHNVLKEYLEANANATLAEKINNGVIIEKDGKKLINKKDLNGFMKYACDEARKLADKGATSACLKSDIVFGWAIHYFEENDIIGKLYNADGSEYKPEPKPISKPIQRVPTPTIPVKPTPPKPQQFTFFDLLNNNAEEEIAEETLPQAEKSTLKAEEPVQEERYFDEEDVDSETGEILRFKTREPKHGSPLYQKYLDYKNAYSAHVVAYRVGDFYEFFGNDAVRLANFLDLTLTGRNCGLEERVPMVGIPYHAAEPYFMKIATKYKLAIVDNGEVSTMENEETVFVNETITEEEKHELFDDDLPQSQPTMYENNDDEDEFEEERALQKFFDKDALCALYELFDYKLDMQ